MAKLFPLNAETTPSALSGSPCSAFGACNTF